MALPVRGGSVFALRPLGVRGVRRTGTRAEAVAEPEALEARGTFAPPPA